MRSIIIEGVDRLGKDTLIKGIKDRFGFLHTVHYQKPELLEMYQLAAKGQREFDDPVVISRALKSYQYASFKNMMYMLNSKVSFIMNRAHLGEFVYAPRYRNYSGEYVFELEKYLEDDSTLLILLYTSSFDFIKDDGLSFDFDKKEEEQNDFIAAFNRSSIKNKLMIDVHDGNGQYKSSDLVLKEVIEAYN